MSLVKVCSILLLVFISGWGIPPLHAATLADNGNKTVTDSRTGLVWQQEEPGGMTWGNALSYCEGLSLGGQDDWRLPNVKELESLTDDARYYPSIDKTYFPNAVASYYWSSTTYAYYPSYAWYVDFGYGFVCYYNKDGNYYVRCVRGGQSGSFGSLSLSAGTKDFGSVTTNTTSTGQSFTISNSGTASLVVSSINLTGGDSGMFTLDKGDSTAGTCGATPTIAPAGSCTVSATFTPTSAGAKATALRIASNDPATPIKDVALSGTGVLPTYTISTGSTGSTGTGSITCAPSATVNQGGNTTCTATPAAGNYVASVTVDSATVPAAANSASYSQLFNNVIASHTMTATFNAKYAVTYNSNSTTGGIVPTDSASYLPGATVTVLGNTGILIKTGYSFAGWNRAADGSGTSQAAASTFNMGSANVTLYAQWTANTYTVTFTSNGGSAVTSQSVAYNTTSTAPTAPTRTGYTFAGWFSDIGLANVFAFTTPITADITLYAKWTVIPPTTYSVIFTSNGGSAVSNQTVTENTTATAPTAPTKTGSTFVGWFSDIGLANAFAFTTPITANTTLYAKWTVIVVPTITYAVTPSAGTGSTMLPATVQTITSGATTSFTIAATAGYGILSVTGCNGTLIGATYTTGATTGDCSVTTTVVKRNGNSGVTADPTIADALKALQAYSGIVSLTPEEKIRYDVAPFDAGGIPQGNGTVDVADVIMILRRSVGIGSW